MKRATLSPSPPSTPSPVELQDRVKARLTEPREGNSRSIITAVRKNADLRMRKQYSKTPGFPGHAPKAGRFCFQLARVLKPFFAPPPEKEQRGWPRSAACAGAHGPRVTDAALLGPACSSLSFRPRVQDGGVRLNHSHRALLGPALGLPAPRVPLRQRGGRGDGPSSQGWPAARGREKCLHPASGSRVHAAAGPGPGDGLRLRLPFRPPSGCLRERAAGSEGQQCPPWG